MLLSRTTTLFRSPPSKLKRPLFQWINITFNKVDEERRKQLGADRTCAEWLLRNGAQVKWVDSEEFLADYNKLPVEEARFHIEEVDASGSSIMHYGFEHFVGCKHIRKMIFDKCNFLEDPALETLVHLKHTLVDMQVTSCLNITEKGLKHLGALDKLNRLVLGDLPYVKDKNGVVSDLKRALPKCNVQYL